MSLFHRLQVKAIVRTLTAAIVCALVLIAARTAAAQIAIYGTFSPNRISGVATGNAVSGGYSTSSFWTYGVGGGATLTVLPLGPVSVGIDLRGSTQPGTQGADTALAGVKVSVKAPLIAFKPYVQASGGYLGTRSRVTTGAARGSSDHQQFAAYEFLGGIDHSFTPLLDLRLVEVGVGRGIFVNGANNSYPDITFVTVNTGLVLHF